MVDALNRAKFYDALKGTNAFGKTLKTDQVVGMEAILNAAIKRGLSDTHQLANVFDQVHHETGGQMFPVKETVYASSQDRNPSDATVISRLDTAFKNGKLPWVRTPYWKNGYFGRGQVQITHEDNYDKLGKAIGVDLIADKQKALLPDVSADIAVVGMMQGLFTGKKLSDYKFPDDLQAEPKKNPRRIINGEDGTDAKVAKTHPTFYNALVAAGYNLKASAPTDTPQAPTTTPTPERTRSVILAEMQALLDELKTLGG